MIQLAPATVAHIRAALHRLLLLTYLQRLGKYSIFLQLHKFTNAFWPVFRCQAKNLIVPTMMPGPKEPDADQIQEYLQIIVHNLLMLFEKGIRVPTLSSPEGNYILLC